MKILTKKALIVAVIVGGAIFAPTGAAFAAGAAGAKVKGYGSNANWQTAYDEAELAAEKDCLSGQLKAVKVDDYTYAGGTLWSVKIEALCA